MYDVVSRLAAVSSRALFFALVFFAVSSVSAIAQDSSTVTVSGKVVDEQGNPMVGVTIIETGGGTDTEDSEYPNATITDADGNYSITVENPETAILNYHFVGMVTETVRVNGRRLSHRVVNVTMEEDNLAIDQVVVTGYQTVNRRELASAVTHLQADKILIDGVMSVDQMLAGQVAGMAVTQTSGSPGSTAKIRVRGISSIIGNKSPLWVLDGIILDDPVEVDHADLMGDDAEYLVGNAIAGINPNDIESITVLKDASATAIYGVQAANGVIVVTTKKGKSGRPHVTYSGTVSFLQRDSYSRLNLMSAYDRIQLSREIIDANLHYDRTQSSLNIGYEGLLNEYESKGLTQQEFRSEVMNMIDRNTDWFSALYRNAVTQRHSLSVSGGNDQTTYYASLGADFQPGTAREERADRYTLLMKVNSWLHPKVYLGFQLNASLSESQGYHTSVNPKNYAYETARTIPLKNSDGSLFYYEPYSALGSGRDALTFNILDEISNTGSNSEVGNVTAKLNFVWNIWNGFKYELQASYIYSNTVKNSWANSDSYYVSGIRGWSRNYDVQINTDEWEDSALPQGGTLDYYNAQVQTYDVRNQIGYNNRFGDHVVSVMGISEVRSSKTDGLSSLYYGYMPERGKTISPSYTERYISLMENGTFQPSITDNVRNVASFRGVASYSYKDKYIINGSISMDGSNQFGSNPKYRFLPIWSVSGKWTVSEEDFMRGHSFFNYLALRASYGIQGNVDSGTSPDLVLRIGDISSETGLAESTVSYWPNADLRWEKTTSYNVGLDFSILGNHLNGTVDFYHKMGTDMIMTKTISGVNGITSYNINAGDVNNTGVEVSLGGYPIRTNDWSLNIQFIYSFNRNVLVKANSDTKTEEDTNTEKINGTALIVGEALGTLYSYDFAYLDHDTGLPIFRDNKGSATSVINGEEVPNYTLYESEVGLVRSGYSTPPSTGGINMGLRYKNWHLNASFTYALGGVARLPSLYNGSTGNIFDPEFNMTTDILDHWRQPGDEAFTNIPALYDDYSYDNLPVKETDSAMGYVLKGSSLYDDSTARICSSDNFRLRTLSLSYTFPARIIKSWKMTSLTMRLQASNLFIIADKRWHGFDPELGPAATTPIPRIYTFSVNVTF